MAIKPAHLTLTLEYCKDEWDPPLLQHDRTHCYFRVWVVGLWGIHKSHKLGIILLLSPQNPAGQFSISRLKNLSSKKAAYEKADIRKTS
mmetsp:Transcript_129776/g.224331  ORF Transcript_129776/g.224331 Transcript_129776/m.224331 type:complete len:89 (-) Transcript_129776:1013-1279(-)